MTSGRCSPILERSPVAVSLERGGAEPGAPPARIGLLTLATDLTSERDFAEVLRHDGVAIHVSRVGFVNPTTPANLQPMLARLGAATELLVPDVPLGAICYSCTAASVVIGAEAVRQAIGGARPEVPVVTPSAAAVQALRALGVKRLAILTPYLIETSRPLAEHFVGAGFEVTRLHCFGLDDDRTMARVSRQTIIEAARALDTPAVEALFISCTALPALEAIDELERRLGKPVVSSNQASLWAVRRHLGLSASINGYGRLFEHRPPMPRGGDRA